MMSPRIPKFSRVGALLTHGLVQKRLLCIFTAIYTMAKLQLWQRTVFFTRFTLAHLLSLLNTLPL